MLKGVRELCGGGQTGRPLPVVNGGLPGAGQGHVWQGITAQGASSLCNFAGFFRPCVSACRRGSCRRSLYNLRQDSR